MELSSFFVHRRMFPGLTVSVWGLDPDTKYTMQVEIVPSGKNRFKYINSKWVPVGKADSHENCSLLHTHPDSPASGKQWMRDRVAFKKIKLTNDKNSKKGYVRLLSQSLLFVQLLHTAPTMHAIDSICSSARLL